MQDETSARRRTRSLTGVMGATALVYPLLFCAVQLAVAQLVTGDLLDAVLWGLLTVLLSAGVVAVVRWSSGRRVPSPWLLVGLVPPLLLELWLSWPTG